MKTNINTILSWTGLWILISICAVFGIFLWIYEKIFGTKEKPSTGTGWKNQKCFD